VSIKSRVRATPESVVDDAEVQVGSKGRKKRVYWG
jgi:hypothetical protein